MIVLAKVELLYIGFPFSVFFGCVMVGKVFGSVCLAEGDIFRKNADSLRKLCFFRAFAGYRAFLRFQSFRHEVVPRVVAMAVIMQKLFFLDTEKEEKSALSAQSADE